MEHRPSTATLRAIAVWLILIAACSAFAYYNIQTWYPGVKAQFGVAYYRALTWELLRWDLWLPIAATIFREKRKRPLHHALGLGLFFYPALHTGLLVATNWILSPAGIGAMLRHRAYVLVPDYLTGIIISGMILAMANTPALTAQLAQAQLDALKMQLQPHFLFNTLNAISALTMEQPETAQRMLVRLSDFLRMTLENSAEQEVTVEREIDFLARYLEIEKLRFPQKLAVEIEIEPEARGAMVPNLILQPIVENAIRHGIGAMTSPGAVEVRAARQNRNLMLTVHDTGPGATTSGPLRYGRGLTITCGRLRRYGARSHFSAANADGGGFEVSIEIPFRRSTGS